MLDKIKFNDSDTLYVLGDIVDRGKRPIEVLRDMSVRANVFPIMGNHDYIALIILKKLSVEITEENYASHIDDNLMEGVTLWLSDGGQTTLDGFKRLSKDKREYILEYLEEFSPYEALEINNKKYILTHAGLPESYAHHNLDEYDITGFVSADTDYTKVYFDNAILVTGHTPTFIMGEEYRGKVFKENNHLAIDTGGVFGESFACVCLDTGEEFYLTA